MLKLHNLFKVYRTDEVETVALNGVNVEIDQGDFVAILASLYRDNSFHCFEHASHVTMSVSKLLSRIVAPDVPEDDAGEEDMDAAMHDYTYGTFSVIIQSMKSALILRPRCHAELRNSATFTLHRV